MTFFDLARRNVSRHWLRSILAVTGIAIGVVAIATLGIMGNSINLMFNDMVSDVGDTITVSPATRSGTTELTKRQVDDITRAVGANRAIPFATTFDSVTVGETKSGAMIYAIPAKDIPFLLGIEAGAYPKDTGSGCVIGKTLAENNKDTGLKLGARATIGNETLRVVGVLEERGMGFDINPDSAIVVPYSWYSNHYGKDTYDQVIVKVRDVNDLDAVKEAIEQKMNRRENVVTVMDTRGILKEVFAAVDSITVFLMGIGAVSLIVAGVSILNVMLMSVTERIKEIGVLRSIGTRRSEVMRMFIYEAAIIGIVGAIIGAIVSIVIGYVIVVGMIGSAEYFFAPGSIVYVPMAMTVGAGICIATGIYPAWRASNLDPIEALQNE